MSVFSSMAWGPLYPSYENPRKLNSVECDAVVSATVVAGNNVEFLMQDGKVITFPLNDEITAAIGTQLDPHSIKIYTIYKLHEDPIDTIIF